MKLGIVDAGELVGDDADAQAERVVDRPHPAAAQARQVVVGCHQVGALARQRVQVQRQRGDQRLALARLHLGDAARVQDGAGEQLDVVVALADRAARGLADGGEGLGQQVVERLARQEAAAELGRLVAQLLVGQRLVLGLERVDLDDERPQALDFALRLVAAQFRYPLEHGGRAGSLSSIAVL